MGDVRMGVWIVMMRKVGREECCAMRTCVCMSLRISYALVVWLQVGCICVLVFHCLCVCMRVKRQ